MKELQRFGARADRQKNLKKRILLEAMKEPEIEEVEETIPIDSLDHLENVSFTPPPTPKKTSCKSFKVAEQKCDLKYHQEVFHFEGELQVH